MGTKIRKNFNQGLYYGDDDYDFDDWNRDAKVDGWICRNDLDCTWIDRNLGCDDRSFSSSQIRGNWPNSFKQKAKGECACQYGYYFNGFEAECDVIGPGDGNFMIGVIIGTSVAFIFGICICIVIIRCVCKAAK